MVFLLLKFESLLKRKVLKLGAYDQRRNRLFIYFLSTYQNSYHLDKPAGYFSVGTLDYTA